MEEFLSENVSSFVVLFLTYWPENNKVFCKPFTLQKEEEMHLEITELECHNLLAIVYRRLQSATNITFCWNITRGWGAMGDWR